MHKRQNQINRTQNNSIKTCYENAITHLMKIKFQNRNIFTNYIMLFSNVKPNDAKRSTEYRGRFQ